MNQGVENTVASLASVAVEFISQIVPINLGSFA